MKTVINKKAIFNNSDEFIDSNNGNDKSSSFFSSKHLRSVQIANMFDKNPATTVNKS